jgi:hypothetical protein
MSRPLPRTQIVMLAAVIVLAAGSRLWQLGQVPPGLTHDEADHGLDTAGVLDGRRPIYFTVGYGREPLYDYVHALTMLLVGRNWLAGRVTAALFGLGLVGLTWAWARRAGGSTGAALAAAGLMAVDFWPVSVSRQALRSITLPVLFVAAAYCLWRALPLEDEATGRGRRVWYALAGVCLGLMFYTYLAARVMWAVFPAFYVYLAIWHRSIWRRAWVWLLATLVIAAVVAAPLLGYLLTHPEAGSRVRDLSAALDALRAGDPSLLLRNISQAPLLFTFYGDDFHAYNIEGKPLLSAGVGALFYVGVGLALARLRRPERAFGLLMVGAGMVPVAVTGLSAANTRTVGMLPAVYFLAGLAADEAATWAARQVGGRGRMAIWVAFGLLVVGTAVATYHAYFVVWANLRETRVAYHTTLVETVRALDGAVDAPPDVALSSIAPGRFHDPAVVQMRLRRSDLRLRWFDARASLVFPAAEMSWLIFPEIAGPDVAFAPLIGAHAAMLRRIELRPDDFNRTVEIYAWNGPVALSDALAGARAEAATSPSDGYVAPGERRALRLPARVGEPLSLLAYDLSAGEIEAGSTLEVVSYWRVEATTEEEMVLFTHVVGPDGQIVGQQDALDVPSWAWRAGDAFAQLHRFAIAPDAPPGTYLIEVGAYDKEGLPRLPVMVDGEVAGTRVILGDVEVSVR